MPKLRRDAALRYHSREPRGKIEVVPTKPTATQRDLALAYSPGVAEPCREIHRDPMKVFEYTAKGNLVAVISNGTAVLGLGDIGALAAKPVMEGKGVLFKRFAGIDVFDIEVDTHDPAELVRAVELIAPTFGGINLEDIKAPECFEIERTLQERLSIPVFHDDQHGTAIIAGAALLNALEITGKKLSEVRIVVSGAGAAAIGCLRFWLELGVSRDNVILADSKGVIHREREDLEGSYKAEWVADTPARTLAEALDGADVFAGLSVGGILKPEMLQRMAKDPLVMAMANPDPEIGYEEAVATRDDVIMATGRSDFPNQVNNVLGFPFLFRGALDVKARAIDLAMMKAACRSLAALAREDVPDSVLKAYGLESLRFGREYLIPKPFDHRVLLEVPPAVAEAARESGAAREPIADVATYSRRLEHLVSRRLEVMRSLIDRAQRVPKRIVFPEGDHDKILRAAKVLVDEGIARPILLARPERIAARLAELDLPPAAVEVVHPDDSDRFEEYAADLQRRRRRDGVTMTEARKLMRTRNYFGTMMVERGDADGLISGISQEYPETIRPALQIIETAPDVQRVAGAYILILKERMFFLADTTVNIDPTAEELADIAVATAAFARRFDLRPRVAMLSFSNFGSNRHPSARKVRSAVEILHQRHPELEVDGEMQADTAVLGSLLEEAYPWSRLTGPANVLIFPELQSANTAYKLIWRLAEAEAIGPILLGLAKPVHVLQRGMEVSDIVNMVAICVVEAQEAAAGSPTDIGS